MMMGGGDGGALGAMAPLRSRAGEAPVLELTDDLLLRVFAKLPTQSLARCEAVCRVWKRTLRGSNAARSVWSAIRAEGLFRRGKLDGRPTLDALLADLTTRAVTLESTWHLHGVGFTAEATHHLRSVDLTGCTGLSMASVLLLVTRPSLASVNLRDTFRLSELDLMVLLSHCGVAFDREVQSILRRGLQNMALWLHPRLRLGTDGDREYAESACGALPPYRLDAALVFTSSPEALSFSDTSCQVRGSFVEWASFMIHSANAAYGYSGAASISAQGTSSSGDGDALVLSGLDLSLSKPWLRSVIQPLGVFLAGGTLREVLDAAGDGLSVASRGASHRFVNLRLDPFRVDLRDARLTDDDANTLFRHCQVAEVLDAEAAAAEDGGEPPSESPPLAGVRLRSPNTSLQVLNVSGNPALQWPQNLFEAVGFFHGLRELNLSGCSGLGPYCGAALGASLAGGSCGTLEVLDVSGVCLGAVGVKGLCMGLRWHVGLRTLRMSDNQFGDEGAEFIAGALMFLLSASRDGAGAAGGRVLADGRGAIFMDELSLAGNGVGDRGAERLAAMLCAVCSQAGESTTAAVDDGASPRANSPQPVVVELLDLSRNALTGTGCASLSVAMIRRPNSRYGAVHSLVLDDNLLVGSRGAGLFATSIMNSSARGHSASPLRKLSVARCGIEAAGASYLASCMRCCGGTLAHLDLRENAIGDAGAIALGCALGEQGRREGEATCGEKDDVERDIGKGDQCADELILRNMGMTGRGVVAMCEALDGSLGAGQGGISLAVRELDLSNNVIGVDGVIALATLMKRGRLSLETLALAGCRCGDIGTTALAAVLAHPNCCLQDLDLGNNSVSCTGVAILAKELVCNKSLRRLDLSHNGFGDEGAYILAKALLPDPDAINVKLDQGLCLDDVIVKHVGSSIAPAAVLREINLRSCCLSHAGIGQLKSAVELRTSVLGSVHAVRLLS